LSAIEAIERLAIEAIRHGTNVPFEPQGNLEETTTLIKPKSSKRTHNRESDESDDSSDSSSSSDSEVDRGTSSKKKRIFEKDMPWYTCENFARQSGELGIARGLENPGVLVGVLQG